MEKLESAGISVYRTDEQGTIECVSNGEEITFNVEPGSYSYMGN
jgi:competence protein ComEC